MKDTKNIDWEQILFDPENQPHQLGKLIWSGNELAFEGLPNIGVAGISPNMPDRLGEEIARRFNLQPSQELDQQVNTEKKAIYNLGLHETIDIPCAQAGMLYCTRVAGGWIYQHIRLDCNSMWAIFVPWNKEFNKPL